MAHVIQLDIHNGGTTMMDETGKGAPEIRYQRNVEGVDWEELKRTLTADDFDNGRTAEQLRLSFANSHSVCFAIAEGKVVGKARILSDGVCNAYLVDVWTHRPFRNRGIAREMIRLILNDLHGQHIYLQSDEDTLEFYRKLGFSPQREGMSLVVGKWLDNTVG